eukprot:gene15572-21027_t
MTDTNLHSTQLAESRPQLDSPLRVAIPVNAPNRTIVISRDSFIYANAFSPLAQNISDLNLNRIVNNYSSQNDESCFNQEFISDAHGQNIAKLLEHTANTVGSGEAGNNDALIKTQIKDFNALALSSKRSNKKDEEATAYVSLGVIHDNQKQFHAAIENYKSYLKICEEISDTIGIACACNCIGVDYMLLACPPSDAGCLQGINLTQINKEYLNKALFYHTKHLEVGPDAGASFVANTNVGLCIGMLGDINQSAKYHQDSLRTAIKMQTLYGQSIAVGNLGVLAMIKGDFSTSKTCFDQHLQLVQALQDPEAEIGGWKLLANLQSRHENYYDALEHLEQAKRIAEIEGKLNELRRIHCLIGVCRGTIEFSSFADQALNDSLAQLQE